MKYPANPPSRRPELVISAVQAAELIPAGSTVVIGGSGSLLQVPESILAAIEQRFIRTQLPAGLEVIHVMGLGDKLGRGIDHLARPGLTKRFIGSHFVLSPAEQHMIARGDVEAIGLPAGTISLLYREIAAGRPGLFTDIGLETFVDPRLSWGRMNDCTATGISELVTVAGREWLFYPTFPIHVAVIRASAADEDGNLGMEDEAALSDNLAIAQAARNTGGIVIAEVKEVVRRGSLPGARVRVPGNLIDHVVKTDYPHQTPITVFEPARTGTAPPRQVDVPPLPLTHLKTIARRALLELQRGSVVNLGVGMANGVSYVGLEEGVLDEITLTVEQGIFGGLPGIGFDSGTAINPTALIDMSAQFDFYDGGGLDAAGLGFAQVGRSGDVNVARAGGLPIGPGGFIDISQKADTVLFCGTFTGGGLQVRIDQGEVIIEHEGRYSKFVETVDEIAFSATRALREGRRALYITERAVFELRAEGLTLIEVAPGIDIGSHIVDQLTFRPHIADDLKVMDARIFAPEPMGLPLKDAPPAQAFRTISIGTQQIQVIP